MTKEKKSHLKPIIISIFILLLLIGVGTFYIVTTPQIKLNGSKTMEVTMKDGYSEPGATASFSFKDISNYIKIKSFVNDTKVGSYEVIYTVSYLNKTSSVKRTVNVVDKEPPEISLIDGDEISLNIGDKYKEPGYTAIDDSDGDVTENVIYKGIVDIYNSGTYKINYTVLDSYGNKALATRKVIVKGKPVKDFNGEIYLTFDDGPSDTVTPEILDILKKNKIHATFFIIDYGNSSDKIKTLKRAIREGHTIGIHGFSHDYSKIYKSPADFMGNITKLHNKIQEDLDYDAFIIRFPGGSSNTVSKEYKKGIMTELVSKVQEEGYLYSDWNVDSTDASGNNIPTDKLISSVKKNCSKDAYNIILMHDSDAKGTTAEALPEIIKWAKKNGYKFKSMTKNTPTVHHGVNN